MQAHAAPAALRPLGAPEDLDLDFAAPDRPALVTALLERCAAPHEGAYWWAQCVGQRTAMLLRVLSATTACSSITLASTCPEPACGITFGFDIELARLLAHEATDTMIEVSLDGGRHVALRRPTGEDLRAWRTGIDPSRADAMHTMLESLRVRGTPVAGDEDHIARVLAEHDPLVDLSVACRCPACGTAHEVPVDLEGLALARLHAAQQLLLREVHEFARHYGWTEADTLAVPRRRRATYRALIETSA